MDFDSAKQVFEKYLDGYDRENDKVRLKIVHTYGVVEQSAAIAGRLGLSQEDEELAGIIACSTTSGGLSSSGDLTVFCRIQWTTRLTGWNSFLGNRG